MRKHTVLIALVAALWLASWSNPAQADPESAYPPPPSKAVDAAGPMPSSQQCSIWMANDRLKAAPTGSLWKVEGQLQAAQCLIASNHLNEARAILAPIVQAAGAKPGAGLDPELQASVLWKYALLEERLGNLASARHSIGVARDISTSQHCAIDEHIQADYERLAHATVARDLP